MTLQSAIEWALPQLRAEALGRMVSRCTIAEPLARGDWPTGDDGMQVPAHVLRYEDRPCRLQRDDRSAEATIGDASEQRAVRSIHLPHDTRLTDGSVVAVTSGEWANTFWRVVEATGKDQATALRVLGEQVAEPKGWGTWVSE